MRKKALATALGVLAVLTLVVGPAHAGRSQAAFAAITSVRAQLVTTGVDACGPYCEYRAAVTLSWNGAIRLWVSHFIDGQRHAPGELRLTGSGRDQTVWVEGIRAEVGTGPLVAEAQVLVRRTWTITDSEATEGPVTCAPWS